MKVLRNKFRFVTKRISARSRIAIGLVFLLVSVLSLAMSMGIVPSERTAIMAGRAKFCEAVAVNSSIFAERKDLKTLEAALRATLARDPDVLSAAVRGSDGRILLEIGPHQAAWGTLSGQAAVESYIYVPIFANQKQWGTMEIRFEPLSATGWFGYLQTTQAKLLIFVGSGCMALYLLYLRKMLQHLDPSKAVPSRVRSALDTLAEGLLVIDNEEQIVLANQSFATFVGRKPEQLLGRKASSLDWTLRDGSKPQTYAWVDAIKGGTSQNGVSMHLSNGRGERRTFSVNCSPVMGHDGQYRGVLVSLDDVTELEHKEVELRKSKQAAENANQAKSEFLARMSHEIRTPMNAILGFADVLRRGFDTTAAQRQEYLDTIHSSGQHLLDLINDILDLSKIEAGKVVIEKSRCAPYQLLRDVVSILSVRAEQKGVGLTFATDGRLPESIETDPMRLRQAVTNLVGNAIKFTEQGSVRVVAKLVNDGPAAKLHIEVTDTGIGMTSQEMGRIFEPFAQADSSITRRFGGTGLGLSISKEIAQALGGELTVTSEPGRGSTFTLIVSVGDLNGVELVAADEAGQHASTASDAVRVSKLPARLNGASILLVEDGVSNRKLIKLVLERAGATVEEAEDGQQGVAAALAGHHDVVLMDMQMPVMDGYTAATLLRSRGYTKPIFALTAHAMRGDADKCLAAGCSHFLSKPVDMDVLVRTIFEVAGGVERFGEIEQSPLAPQPLPSAPEEEPAKADALPIVSTLPSDDPEFCEIIVEFINRMQTQLESMRQAHSGGDLKELASLAHWVKGSGGTAGFHPLTEPARHLEQIAKEQRLDEIAGAIASLQELADRMVVPAGVPSASGNSH